jgi:hypothetical protein
MLRVEVGKRARMPKQALALFGLRLELVAEVRRAVSRGSAHPKKEVERRRKVSSAGKCGLDFLIGSDFGSTYDTTAPFLEAQAPSPGGGLARPGLGSGPGLEVKISCKIPNFNHSYLHPTHNHPTRSLVIIHSKSTTQLQEHNLW